MYKTKLTAAFAAPLFLSACLGLRQAPAPADPGIPPPPQLISPATAQVPLSQEPLKLIFIGTSAMGQRSMFMGNTQQSSLVHFSCEQMSKLIQSGLVARQQISVLDFKTRSAIDYQLRQFEIGFDAIKCPRLEI